MHGHPHAGNGSLHVRIRADIEQRIRSGEWPPGHRIPTETELMNAWKCSRMTVHKAVTALAAEGYVERNRRAGTVVARPRLHAAALRIPDIRAEVEARGLAYGYRLLLDELRPACCIYLGAEGHELGPSRFVRSVHLAGLRALVFEERHIFIDSVPSVSPASFLTEPPGPWLIAHVPWTEAEHRISAIGAEGQAAKALGLTTGTPCLRLERRTWRGPETITIVCQTIRGDAFDFLARFTPN